MLCYHFQRMFSLLCDYTLVEYIRNCRMTPAGIDLSTTQARVIDMALKYGYDSPDSFVDSPEVGMAYWPNGGPDKYVKIWLPIEKIK